MNVEKVHTNRIGLALCIVMATASGVLAQTPGGPAAGSEAPTFKPEELEQLLAPVALYPDSLVSQVLMASTYPLEVVQADRWVKRNKNLQGDVLTKALEKETWDPSVKSLVNFPQVLSMMSEKLDWTTNLGDAFLAQQKDVMETIQKLRARAKAEGNLETTKEQTVVVKEEAQTQVIVIEPADPQVVYVPTYNPTVVYGAWPYPAYPPYYYYPPGYVAGSAAVGFGVGFACGAAWGYAWGDCDWHGGDVDIDVDRNTFVNNKIDRSRYKSEIGSRNRNAQNGRGSWQHDPSHRKGASYRDANSARKFGGTSTADAAKARDSYRGRAETGRQDLARGGADQFRGGQSPAQTGRGTGDRGGAASRQQPAARQQPASRQQPAARSQPTTQDRGTATDRSRQSQASRGGAFDGAGQGNRARAESQRGQASRSSYSGGGGARGGGMRGGGGRGGRR